MQSYRPNNRLGAIARAKSFKQNWAYNQKRKPFATEQKPGSGGLALGSAQLSQRLAQKGAEKRRAESFRPENAISRDIYRELAT